MAKDTRVTPSKVRVKSRSAAQRECDLAHGRYVRLRDTIHGVGHCISCGRTITYNTCQAGHYIDRAHMATRWDDHNVNAQCVECNEHRRGNIPGYTLGLMDKYGPAEVDRLCHLRRVEVHYSTREIQEITEKYKQKIKQL